MDPNYASNNELEFLVEDESNVVVIGLMYRALGREADGELFGELATRVRSTSTKPKYYPSRAELTGAQRAGFHLTYLLEQEHRERQLIVSENDIFWN
jgi:hypothetical protein